MTQPYAALIVAHGQPSDPESAEAEIAELARRVAAFLPGWHVGSATLANPGALSAQVANAGPRGLVFPLFMAGGWFTRENLPARLAEAGAQEWRILAPFGTDDGVQALTVTLAREAAAAQGRAPDQCDILLAAHGSFRSPAPADVARAMAARIAQEAGFRRVEAAFIDQSPRIADVAATFAPGALVLPFFAARGGHVIDDIPRALTEAQFDGVLLDPVGLDPRVPGIIAAAIRAGA
jgi:sirohydrochlorin ferrochelatase